MIRLKDKTVNLNETHPAIWSAIAQAAVIWARHGSLDLVLTSVNDGVHPGGVRPSFHPKGQAVDVRVHELDDPIIACEELRTALGPDYDVLYESAGTENVHAHVQFDP